MKLLVHRKGSTRAFPPHHPLIPVDYQLTGETVQGGGWLEQGGQGGRKGVQGGGALQACALTGLTDQQT